MDKQPTMEQIWEILRKQDDLVQRQGELIAQLRHEQSARPAPERRSWPRLGGLGTNLVRVITLVSLACWLLAPAAVQGSVAAPVNAWTPVAPMPTSRDYPTAATAPNGKIYVIGGFQTAAGILATVEAYDPQTNTWTCTVGDLNCVPARRTIPPMPTARFGMQATTGPDGKIYVIGGQTFETAYDLVEAYNPATNTWICAVSDTGTGCTPSNSTLPRMATPHTHLAAATGPDGRIYAVGGLTTALNTTDYACSVEAYTPGSASWTRVTGLANCVWDHGAAFGIDGRLYVFGGNLAGSSTTFVQAFDFKVQKWFCSTAYAACQSQQLLPPMDFDRESLATVAGPDGLIYVLGGYSTRSGGFYESLNEAYDPRRNYWLLDNGFAPTEGVLRTLPSRRDAMPAAAGQDGRIYIFGGYEGNGGDTLADAEAYVPVPGPTPGYGSQGTPGLAGYTLDVLPDSSIRAGVFGRSLRDYGGYFRSGAGTGVFGTSSSGRGGTFAGAAAQLRLIPNADTAPPTTGQAGDLYVSTDPSNSTVKHLWFCTRSNVGTAHAIWKQVA